MDRPMNWWIRGDLLFAAARGFGIAAFGVGAVACAAAPAVEQRSSAWQPRAKVVRVGS